MVGHVECRYVYVDGLAVGDVGESLLTERRILGDGGFIAATVVVDSVTGKVVGGPTVSAKGFSEDPAAFDAGGAAGHRGAGPGRRGRHHRPAPAAAGGAPHRRPLGQRPVPPPADDRAERRRGVTAYKLRKRAKLRGVSRNSVLLAAFAGALALVSVTGALTVVLTDRTAPPAPESTVDKPESAGNKPEEQDPAGSLAGEHVDGPASRHRLGAFLGSGEEGVAAIDGFQAWLGAPVTVGPHVPAGPPLDRHRGRGLGARPVDGVGRAARAGCSCSTCRCWYPNEPPLEPRPRTLLRQGADGAYDGHFQTLAERLVERGARGHHHRARLGDERHHVQQPLRRRPRRLEASTGDRIVAAMRAVPGQRFRFDFTPVRGAQAIAWTSAIPGDDVVDIIGMDTYDQHPGRTFDGFRAAVRRPARARRVRRRARQADVLPGVGPVRLRRRRGATSGPCTLDHVARRRLPDHYRLLPARRVGVRRQPRRQSAYREMFGTP